MGDLFTDSIHIQRMYSQYYGREIPYFMALSSDNWQCSPIEMNFGAPSFVDFAPGKTYIFQAELKDNLLSLYVYEKGTQRGNPVVTLHTKSDRFTIYGNVINGDAKVYDAFCIVN